MYALGEPNGRGDVTISGEFRGGVFQRFLNVCNSDFRKFV